MTISGFSADGNCNLFNNFIVGGADITDTQNDSYGVYVLNSDNDVIIYYNSFERDGSLDGFLNDGITSFITIATMEIGYNPGIRSPSGNLDHVQGDINFSDRNSGDYTITGGGDLSSILNNGYDLSFILSSGELAEATLDRLNNIRPVTTMDRGGHEFSP